MRIAAICSRALCSCRAVTRTRSNLSNRHCMPPRNRTSPQCIAQWLWISTNSDHFRRQSSTFATPSGSTAARGHGSPTPCRLRSFSGPPGTRGEALDLLGPAVAASPCFGPRACRTGTGDARIGSSRGGAAALAKAVELDPAAGPRLMLGKAYLRLGRKEEGERELRLGREGWSKQDYGSSKNK